MRLLALFGSINPQLNEKVKVAPRNFLSYSQNRVKDINTIEQLLQRINARKDKWLRHDDVYAYNDMWKDADRFIYDESQVDLDHITRNTFGSYSNNGLERMRYNLTAMIENLGSDGSGRSMDFVAKLISHYVDSSKDIEEFTSHLAAFNEVYDELIDNQRGRGYGRDEFEEYPEELKAMDDFYATMKDIQSMLAPAKRVADSVPKYQVVLDKRGAFFNSRAYRPTDMQDVDTMWHATVHADAIVRDGFQAETPQGRQGVGSYGNQGGISATYDQKIAIDIMRALREFAMIANGDITVRQMLSWFQSEGIDLERVKSMMDGRPFEETLESKTKMFNVYLWLTGLRSNPVFANVDELTPKLVGVNPKDIGILELQVDTTQQMESKPAEAEFVISPSAVLSVKRIA
jgi:hypothetical protein